jgi:WD40 repeat-containing protein SMU1
VLEGSLINKEHSEFRYDLFLDIVVKEHPLHKKARNDGLPRKVLSKIDMTKKSHAESGCFSPDGNYFVTGSIDGFIEVWNYNSGKLSADFEYQRERKFMSCDTAVLSLCFSKNGSLLAAGTQSGQIKLFTFLTGKTVKIIEKAQSKGVISVTFLNDMSGVICGGFDGSIKLFGLKSGRVLKEFYGHTSYVSSLHFNEAGNALISASGDGSVRIWNTKTCSCVHKVRLDENETNLPPVLSICFVPGFSSIVATATSRGIYLVDISTGKTVSSMNLQREIIGFAVSGPGILFAVTDDYQLYSFAKRKESFTYDQKMLVTIHETEMIAFTSNPKSSILASFHEDGMLVFYSS